MGDETDEMRRMGGRGTEEQRSSSCELGRRGEKNTNLQLFVCDVTRTIGGCDEPGKYNWVELVISGAELRDQERKVGRQHHGKNA